MDRNGDAITRYEVDDLNPATNSAHWELDGAALAGILQINSSQFDRLLLRGAAGTGPADDQMMVRVYDGQAWGNWTTFEVTSTGGDVAPVVTASMLSTLPPAAHVHVSGSLQMYDQNNDPMTQFEIYGLGSAGGVNRMFFDGVAISGSSTQPLTFTDLSKLELAGAAVDGNFRDTSVRRHSLESMD